MTRAAFCATPVPQRGVFSMNHNLYALAPVRNARLMRCCRHHLADCTQSVTRVLRHLVGIQLVAG